MHTPDLSDEELDALFRQGAERYPEELNLGAWARMEQKLDEAHVQQLVNRKVARLFAAEIGIVAVLLLIWGGYREYLPLSETAAPAAAAVVGHAAAPGNDASAPIRPGAAAGTTRKLSPAAEVAAATAAASQTAEPAETRTEAPGQPPVNAADPAVSAPAELAVGPNSRRKTRRVPLTAGALAADEPGATTEAGEAATRSAAGRTPNRRRRQAKLNAALLAAATARPKHPAASAAASREMSARWSEHTIPTTAAALNDGSAPAAAEAGTGSKAASRTNRNVGSKGGQGTSASTGLLPLPSVSSNQAGALQPASESALLAAPAAAATRGNATGTTTAGADQPNNEGAGLTADALRPLTTALLTMPAEELPATLPADSIVRRRPRPFVPSRIFITGLYAPELTTVRNAGFERPGHSAGIQVEYLLLPRLRLNVGLLSSMKYYQARGSDYTWPRPPMYTIPRVEGTCRITDVPVNLRFDAMQGVRYRAFVSAGLSSLLMRDEQYYYHYNNYGTSYSRTWQVKKGSKHLFSVVNLSAGLERQLSLRWALQAEPYVKLPLGGVGAGKVRLSSGGVFFGLKYGL
ncbi:hypothetical protein [Hymenobacter jeollabukensis]|uniref:PorT family protein n=1 Tax=Hymenobacter jeollabukensis TaxID=2025313 RepID=A0A5R8WMK5_9BACT|nr:hypothetical protein [Hymenobacter jeollabukensis]TLM90597.1 hypothetical protein FDY95_17955 [Hymenobacter jeollabukensis]